MYTAFLSWEWNGKINKYLHFEKNAKYCLNDICDLIDTVQICKDLLLMSHILFMAL